jgi:lipopolysaccharide export system permease protein
VDGFVVENRGNMFGDKESEVKGAHDANGIHVSGRVAFRKTLTVERFTCVIPPNLGRDSLTTLQATTARYIPPREGGPEREKDYTGGWMLTGTTPPEIENWRRDDVLEMIAPGKYFLRTDIDFDVATRSKNWHIYMPTWQLLQVINRPGGLQVANLAVIFHMRLTRPILGIVLVLLGLSVILRDQNRNVFISAGLCLGLCALFFATCIACQYLGNHEFLAPALAAWLPVLMFGPLAFVMFDAVHT